MSSFKSQQEFGAGGSSLLFLGVGDRGLNGAAVHKDDRGIVTVENGLRWGVFVGFSAGTLTGVFSMRPHVLPLLARRLLMPSLLPSHLLSTAQLGFTFLTVFLMFKPFS